MRFRRKLGKVHKLLVAAGADGIGKGELTRRTLCVVSGPRDRDAVLASLEKRGLAVVREITANGGARHHCWAAEFAPPEGDGSGAAEGVS